MPSNIFDIIFKLGTQLIKKKFLQNNDNLDKKNIYILISILFMNCGTNI